MARMFGTDGVRGVAGSPQLDRDLAVALGRAAVRRLGPEILIGRDSRSSGPMLEQALVDGICAEGGTAHLAGIIPTPAVAYLTHTTEADCGIVISASHNPPEYNGIKFFDADGFKLPDAVEDEVQAIVEELRGEEVAAGEAERMADATQRYIDHAVGIAEQRGVSLAGLTIALDCAYGASCETTPAALRALGADLVVINDVFDGEKINVDCGSTHLGPVTELLETSGADLALAHDGDADRLLAVAPGGQVADGDFIIAICALDMQERGVLENDLVVTTVMANLGFTQAMEAAGIVVASTKVGDRYVLQTMREQGGCLGGEQSGHIIFLQHNTTGDGLATAINLLCVIATSGKPLSELMGVMKRYPQSLVNVRVRDKALYGNDEAISEAEMRARERLGGEGRLLVRPSGTEPLIRVMVEATTQQEADEAASEVAAVIADRIGGDSAVS
ncbi:MAG: phosphoglucosamine mutase [Coriobacteriaceae bacterium]|nr:phosphoglucosamine mutase [Coriobacteriaceae bacterium]